MKTIESGTKGDTHGSLYHDEGAAPRRSQVQLYDCDCKRDGTIDESSQ